MLPGLEVRTYQPENGRLGELRVLRIDPTAFTFHVHYRPGEPAFISGWREVQPDAVAFVNANFFDPNHHVLGLLVTEGTVYGAPYFDRGGTFLVQNGMPRIRANLQEPYVSGEAFEQAIQGFPMLIQDGVAAFTSSQGDRVTRRTAIGIDRSGRVLLMSTPFLGITLTDLSAFLAETDMDLFVAFNLDGGGSTMMYHVTPETAFVLPSLDPVPAVLAIYPR